MTIKNIIAPTTGNKKGMIAHTGWKDTKNTEILNE